MVTSTTLTLNHDELLFEAQAAATRIGLDSNQLSIDICRHPNCHTPSFRLFNPNTKTQIGSISRIYFLNCELLRPNFKPWKANKLNSGLPVSERFCQSLDEALKFALEL